MMSGPAIPIRAGLPESRHDPRNSGTLKTIPLSRRTLS
jgi:hypothetical protein